VKRLLLVRHGETAWNAAGKLQGQEDIPLSDKGIEQSKSLRPFLGRYAIQKVLSSDLQRAFQTAQALGFENPRLEPRLREAKLGVWEGVGKAVLRKASGDNYIAWREGRFTPEGGESFQALCERLKTVLDELPDTNETTLLVTHGGVVRAALASLLNIQPSMIIPAGPGSLTVISLNGRPRLEHYNLTAYTLPDDGAI
jgi:glucosyl-3-phosphoglycerate phosphatase